MAKRTLKTKRQVELPPRAKIAGRVSVDTDSVLSAGFSSLLEIAPRTHEEDWRSYALDAKTLDRMNPARLLELLADLSPDVSKALWDFLRFCNPGWEAKALRPNSEKEEVERRAQVALDAFLSTLDDLYGSVDVVFGRLFFSAFLRGAIVSELVLDKQGRAPVDLATPDPASIKFERKEDEVRGFVDRMFQWQKGEKVYLDRPTIRYAAIDPFPGSPYGRPMVAPALFSTLFLLGLLHDLRRVVAQQGYPRLDLSVSLEALQKNMPANVESDPNAAREWVNEAIQQVIDAYSELEPDDAFIHTDSVTVNRPVGAIDASSLGGVGDLIYALERMSTRALKSMPLLMGSNEGTSETHANRQWEVHAAGIKSIQHYAEKMLERLLGLGLQAQGLQAKVKFRFAELRASEEQRDQMTLQLKLENARTAYDNGLVSQDEQAQMALGKDKADQAAPRSNTEKPETAQPEMTPEPGSNRARPFGQTDIDCGEELRG